LQQESSNERAHGIFHHKNKSLYTLLGAGQGSMLGGFFTDPCKLLILLISFGAASALPLNGGLVPLGCQRGRDS